MKKTFKLAVVLILIFVGGAQAQKQALTREMILAGQRSDNPAEIIRWTDNNSFIIHRHETDKSGYFEVKIKGKKITETKLEHLPVKNYTQPTVRADGVYIDNELVAGGKNLNPQLSPDGNYLAYTRDNDLYATRLSDKKEFRFTSDGSDVILNGYASWVYMEEILGRQTRNRAFWWSPDSKTLAFFRTDDSGVPTFSITDSPGQHGYIETMRYPKAGDPNPKVRIALVGVENGTTVWADFDNDEDRYFGKPCWTPSGKSIWVQWINRDQNDYRIFDLDVKTGTKKEIYRETQTSWINIDKDNTINFLSDGKAIIFSEKSKYYHLYLHAPDGSLINPITEGNFSVLDIVKIDERNRTVYFTCYKDNLACRDFYKVSFDGKNLKRLSFGKHSHGISLSPDAKYFVTSYSDFETPVKSDLYDTDGQFVAKLHDSRNAENEQYEWPKTELVVVKSDDGNYDLPLRITYPPNFDKNRKYPVLIDIYGGPAAVSVNQGWIGNSKMLNLYALEGLIQVSFDHRGSLHFGKRGQDEMYRNLGKVETIDYSTCVKWLTDNAQADPERICIRGFSYGGYITCYTLATAPEIFTHGIAGGSVTDWTLYDAPYTERYMDTPAENPDGYRQSSALVHANKIKGKLLLTHGLIDENVHAQNTFRLASLLEDGNKDFELMIYPSERHGYGGAKGRHFRNLQEKFIYEHLLRKPLPKIFE